MKLKFIAAAAMAVAALPAAHAVDFPAGDWTLSIGGNINAFYTHSDCKQPAGTVTGTALGDAALACGGKTNSSVIGNGLLPSILSLGAKTKQNGFDIGANFGIGVATATSSSIANNSAVDVRQAYATVGTSQMGSFKLGRDYGLYSLHAVLNDMTLLSVGAATRATQNGRVSLGHLGSGQVYPGTYGQMAYTSPNLNGFTVDLAIMNPVDTTSTAVDSVQYQARGTYAGKGFKAWAALKSQKFDNPNGFTMNAGEIGGAVDIGPVGLVANYQAGKGVGILSDGDQGNVKGKNYFVQGTVKAAEKVKLGLSVGRSSNDTGIGAGLKSNENVTGAVYYSLTKGLTLVAEAGQTKSKAFSNATAKQNSLAFGGIFFF